MLVDVKCLRQGGVKLTPEELAQEPFIRGHLVLYYAKGNYGLVDQTPIRVGVANLMAEPLGEAPVGVGDLLPMLMHCHVHSIKGNDMVLHGRERAGYQGLGPETPQAWWVRPVLDAQSSSATEMSPGPGSMGDR